MATDLPRIILVDDAVEVRLLVKTRLRLSGRLDVVAEASDGADAVELVQDLRPELVLLDVSMPGMDGLTALPQILAASPTTRVVFYSGFEERGFVDRAMELGASGFVEKSVPVDTLVDRLLEVLDGRPLHPQGAAGRARAPDTGDQAVLDEHLERFREVFEEAAIGMATMTLSGTLVRANRALAAVIGRPAHELVGIFYGHLTDDRVGDVLTVLEELRSEGLDVLQLEHGLASSTDQRLVRATFAPVRDSAGRPLYIFLQVEDVTAERAAVEALRKGEERFRFLVEAVQDYAIFMLDPTGHIVSWNAGAQRSKGYTAEEIIGQHFRVFYPRALQESRHPEHELELALRDGQYAEEGWRLRKDGTRFWASVVITAVFDDAQDHLGFAKVTRDTTERRRLEQEREQAVEALAAANHELELLNRRLQEAAEDQAQFLAVTAHELRTPIGVLAGSAELLGKHWSQLEELEREELVGAMASGTARLRRLLDDLLTASRLQSSALRLNFEQVLVSDVVADAVSTVRRTHPDAEVVTRVAAECRVFGDRDRLAQALDNLIGNAMLHGRPPIEVSVTAAAGTARIEVRDQGSGVSAAVRPRLFERFATGLSKGGTGLGLFIVRELARAHGGEASYEPVEDGGSGTFVIALPLSD